MRVFETVLRESAPWRSQKAHHALSGEDEIAVDDDEHILYAREKLENAPIRH